MLEPRQLSKVQLAARAVEEGLKAMAHRPGQLVWAHCYQKLTKTKPHEKAGDQVEEGPQQVRLSLVARPQELAEDQLVAKMVEELVPQVRETQQIAIQLARPRLAQFSLVKVPQQRTLRRALVRMACPLG